MGPLGTSFGFLERIEWRGALLGPLLALLEPLRVLLDRLWGSLGRPLGDLPGGLLGVPKSTLKHPLN